MTSPVIFSSEAYSDPGKIPFAHPTVLFHGHAVDEREESAIQLGGDAVVRRVKVAYDSQTMTLKIGDGDVGADDCCELFGKYISDANIVLEATSMDFSELLCTIRALIELGVSRFQVLYLEPQDYSRSNHGNDLFALSELIVGYRPIPHAVVDLSSDDVEAGVFFLGYEPERLERALEEYQMIGSKEIKVVFGVPAFKPGWELNSIVPHLSILNDKSSFQVAYCAANDPGSAFDCLEETRLSLQMGNRMFVAPIGTKPCGIASAIFASLFPDQVGVLYDHPKKKEERSKGVSVGHRYVVSIQNQT
ncbi:hypothetical protein [Dechloromonas agitata]|uniref:hypothetical protein n=1 Tax=Dechloromonas agitata TaxID=73030 RepID=UPI0012FC99ED|nr:hypothetical protein [Dechloromonas agitata]